MKKTQTTKTASAPETAQGKPEWPQVTYQFRKAVRINDLSGSETVAYIAHSESDCRDSTDKSVFREVMRSLDVITMGKVIGEPIDIPERISDTEATLIAKGNELPELILLQAHAEALAEALRECLKCHSENAPIHAVIAEALARWEAK